MICVCIYIYISLNIFPRIDCFYCMGALPNGQGLLTWILAVRLIGSYKCQSCKQEGYCQYSGKPQNNQNEQDKYQSICTER